MGRFSHEALMVDPDTGLVYETEDAGNSGLYKFVPYRKGHMDQGGRLYMLAIRGRANLTSASSIRSAADGRSGGCPSTIRLR
jgi:secreted PhoX family phosphatase